MNGVVTEKVNKIVSVHERVVNSHDSGLACVFTEGRAEDETTNSAEAIDADFDV